MKTIVIAKLICSLAFLCTLYGVSLAQKRTKSGTATQESVKKEAGKPGVFYSITGKGLKDTCWLFGTYHLINDSYLTQTPAVFAAFQKSKSTVVEVILDSAQLAAANAKAILPDKRLTQLLDQSFADSLDAELKATIGQGIEPFQSFKPMAVMITLSIVYLMKDNQALLKKYTGQPLDASFVTKSKQATKPVIALETIDQQMDLLFNAFSEKEQAVMLQSFLRNKEESVKTGNELLNIYFENDMARMYALYQKYLKASRDSDFLIKKRNDQWSKRLPALLTKESVFIAVGALHLAGPDGLVEQLRQAGYRVEPHALK